MSDEYDVVVVGGGPAGCSAGIFTARNGLDTLIFDRGRSSIKRCAHLENYLGFPAGIDTETLYGLMHEHAETAGCEIAPDLVESVDRAADGDRFVVEPQDGEPVTARRVITATRYDGEYMRGLDDDAAMFETYEHDGEVHEHFDSEYAALDGTTPVEGLYVASPSDAANKQAIMAAGRGARVAHRVIADDRIDDGLWENVANSVDWVRREAELDESTLCERYREWFDEQVPDNHDLTEERFVELRTAALDRRLAEYISTEEIDARATAGQRALLAHIDDELVLERAREIDAERNAIEIGN